MILRACNIREFMKRCQSKEVVCYGAGNWLGILSEEYSYNIEDIYSYVVDSNSELWGHSKKVGKKIFEVKSPQYLYDNATKNTVVLITSGEHYIEIFDRLNAIKSLSGTDCYVCTFLKRMEQDSACYDVPQIPAEYRMCDTPRIPKIINYMWFGGNPLPDYAKRCMESWRKYAPDYEIVEWNETNYDISKHEYMRQAAKMKKWVFIGDYARLDIVYEHGGFYLDLDVQLLKNIDELRYNRAFCGFETINTINMGSGFGAEKGCEVLRFLRDCYDNIDLEEQLSQDNVKASPYFQTEAFKRLGAKIDGKFQIVKECAIYPAAYFTPKSWSTKKVYDMEYSYSIHHFVGSWVDGSKTVLDAKAQLFSEAMENELRK